MYWQSESLQSAAAICLHQEVDFPAAQELVFREVETANLHSHSD